MLRIWILDSLVATPIGSSASCCLCGEAADSVRVSLERNETETTEVACLDAADTRPDLRSSRFVGERYGLRAKVTAACH